MKMKTKDPKALNIRKQRKEFLARIWAEPEGKWWQQRFFHFMRICAIIIQEFKKDAVTLRASALTFTIVLSLVPMLALSTAVLKGLGAGDQLRGTAYKLIAQVSAEPEKNTAGDQKTSPPSPADTSTSNSRQGDKPADKDLSSHLRAAVDQVFDYVDRTNFATLGAAGIIILFFTVIMVIGSIEEAMNAIWRAPYGRPLGRRIMDYLALMVLFPIAINAGLGMSAALNSPVLTDKLKYLLPANWLLILSSQLFPFLVLTGTFTLLYQFLPNTKVKFFPALAGGLAGTIGLLLIQKIFLHLQLGVARYNAIYGSFATVPLFLLWIHLGWIVFLTGAEVAFALQVYRYYQPKQTIITPVKRLALSLDLLTLIFKDFQQQKQSNLEDVAQTMNEPEPTVRNISADLLDAGLLRRVNGNEDYLMPAGPAETMKPSAIIDIIWGKQPGNSPGGKLTAKVMQAVHESTSRFTIAKVMMEKEH
ncbi:MAG: YihY/virulence factor BrkB family protein [Pseudomonadota bacterium]|nr:YihY/virulence factor BrkB family protein [Pseudomonadota bacterium]